MADISKFTPDGGTTEYNFKDAQARADIVSSFSASEGETRDTVGWVGKNKLQIPSSVTTQTINEVTFTITRNSEGEVIEIDVNGTASAIASLVITTSQISISDDMILSGCPSNGGENSYALRYFKASQPSVPYWDNGSGVSIPSGTTIDGIQIRIANGYTCDHVKFYPMLRKASIIDDTYEPYHPSVEEVIEQVYADNGVLGAKNLIDNWTRKSNYGNDEKLVRVDDAYRVYTSTSNTYERAILFYKAPASNRDFTISTTATITSGGARIDVSGNSTDSLTNATLLKSSGNVQDGEIEVTFNTGSYAYIIVELYCSTTNAASGDVLYDNIMLYLDTFADKTYKKPSKTNIELTESVTPIESAVTDIVNGTINPNVGNTLSKIGKIVNLNLGINNLTADANDVLFKIPSGYRPKQESRYVVWANGAKVFKFQNSGNVICGDALNDVYISVNVTWIIS